MKTIRLEATQAPIDLDVNRERNRFNPAKIDLLT